ncbi:MAG: DNA polymerase IV [Deltaproteobacteria bacterium]|nr:DNA polymerase IV [Deltaproteobacteria bacterium]
MAAPRVIMHIDMNAFFASVEQQRNPNLRGKPVAVIGSAERTVVTTASYEARARGVKTGMSKYEAREKCPDIILVAGDSGRYVDTSIRILGILKEFSPKVEVYSIDEAFLDVTGCLSGFASPEEMAIRIKERIRGELGLRCSIGIAPNKLLAKLASDMQKPDGLVTIGEERIGAVLEDLPVEELWGIGSNLKAHLNGMGIRTCGELGRYPVYTLRKRFGIIGDRLSRMGRGEDDSPVVPDGEEEEAKSVGHSTTLPFDIADPDLIRQYLLMLSEMVGCRARRYGLRGRCVALTVRYSDFFTFSRQKNIPVYTNETHRIYQAILSILDSIRLRKAVRLLGVRISSLAGEPFQEMLFEEDRKMEWALAAMDRINGRFGEFKITWADIIEGRRRTLCHPSGVIPPSWRPDR